MKQKLNSLTKNDLKGAVLSTRERGWPASAKKVCPGTHSLSAQQICHNPGQQTGKHTRCQGETDPYNGHYTWELPAGGMDSYIPMGRRPVLWPIGKQSSFSVSLEDIQQQQSVSPQEYVVPTTMPRQMHSCRRSPRVRHQTRTADKVSSLLTPSQDCKPIKTIGSSPCPELFTRLLKPEEQPCSGFQLTVEFTVGSREMSELMP